MHFLKFSREANLDALKIVNLSNSIFEKSLESWKRKNMDAFPKVS